MAKMYRHTTNEVSMSRHSKIIAPTDTQTDTQTVWKHYLPAYPGCHYYIKRVTDACIIDPFTKLLSLLGTYGFGSQL